MKVVIVEDETPAAEKLERYLHKYDTGIEILAKLTNIEEAVSWLTGNQQEVDLIFMDIQLTDGLSFEIFSKLRVDKPVIFTTAFDEYAIDAFKVNSIDYLLKPIIFTDLSRALKKFRELKAQFSGQQEISKAIKDIAEKKFKDRFLVRMGSHIRSVKAGEIALFYADGRTVYLITMENKKFIIEYKLEDVYNMLNQKMFFRVNRTFIININSIKDVVAYSNSRLNISLHVNTGKEIVVSREKVKVFKQWFGGN